MRNTRNYLDVHSVVDGPIVPPTPPTPPTPPDPVTYDVTLPEGTGYTAAFVAGSSSPALEGSSVNFTVVPDDGHVITSVTDGTNTLTAVNGVYTIEEIAANIAVVVEAVPLPTYTVALPKASPEYTAAFVAGSSSPALAGSTVYFTIIPTDGYEITSVTDVNHNNYNAVNGVYTINAIAVHTTIYVVATPVTPPAPVTYTVTFTGDAGYNTAAFVAGSSSPAVAGSVVNFTVEAKAGYGIIEVSDGTNTLTDVNGVYTINGIDADTTITVKTDLIPAPVTYIVKLETGEGYTAAFVAGSSSPAVAGSVVNFTVVAEQGYEITSVTDNRGNAYTDTNGVYTINGIAANTTISVTAQ